MGGGGGGGGSRSGPEAIRQITLALDGVFFLDGEFAGPDDGKMFEQTVAEAEAHRMVARIAKDGHYKGMPASDILAEIEKVTGVAPDSPPMPPHLRNPAAAPEDFRAAALQAIAFQLVLRRRLPQGGDDDHTVLAILGWNDAALPDFRKAA